LALSMASAGCARLGQSRGGEDLALRIGSADIEIADMAAAGADGAAADPVVEDDVVSVDRLVSTGGASYRLRSGDSVVIHLRTVQLEQFEMVIDENGEVKLPHIGGIGAAGLTGSELENRIQKAYIDQKIFRYLTVNVLVPTRSYYVRGEVRAPGRYPLAGSVTVLRAIATAGGYTDFANTSDIRLTRGDQTTRLNGKDIERSPEKDIEVEAGDVIVVRRTWY
jgi:polysaccharide export outer membrane protein